MEGAPQFLAVDDEVPLFGVPPPPPCACSTSSDVRGRCRRRLSCKASPDEAAWAKDDPDYRGAVARRVHSILGKGAADFGADAEPFDAVIEVWIADADRLAKQADSLRRRREAFCDAQRSFTAVTQERWIGGGRRRLRPARFGVAVMPA